MDRDQHAPGSQQDHLLRHRYQRKIHETAQDVRETRQGQLKSSVVDLQQQMLFDLLSAGSGCDAPIAELKTGGGDTEPCRLSD